MIETAGVTTSPAIDAESLARNAFEASATYFDSAVRSQFDADLRQFYGIHPAGSKYHSESWKGKSKIFRPKTRMAIRKNEAIAAEALFSTADVVSITPTDSDNPQHVAGAEIMKELLQYRLTKSIPWFVTTMGAYQDAQSVGICVSYQYWQYDQKKKLDRPCVDLLPPENVRFDPSCDWRDVVNTSPYFIHMMPMYVKDVRARMKRLDAKTGEPKWTPISDEEIKKSTVTYSDSTRQLREEKRPDSASADRGISDYTVVWVYRIFMEIDGEDKVWYCLGNTYKPLTKPTPVSIMYWHGKRPYQVGFCVVETHKTHPSGLPRLTSQQQAEINEVANSRIDNVKLAMTKRWKAKRGKQVDVRSLTRNIPNSVTMLTEMDDIEPIEFSDVTASSYQEQDRLNLDFDDMAGSFSQSSVQSNRNLNETVGGLNLISNGANQLSAYQLRVWIETWLEPVLRQLVLLEQYYEDSVVILQLAGKKARAFERYGIDAITDEILMQELTINVNVGMSATNPQQQVERFVFGLRQLHDVLADGVLQQNGANVSEITKEVMGKLGYRDGARFFPEQGADPEKEALRQQVQSLTQQIESKRPPPELTAAQVSLIEAQVAKLEAEAAQIEQAMGAHAQDTDIQNEVEAQIADVMKRAEEAHAQLKQTIGKQEQTMAQMRADQSTRENEIASRERTAKYSADTKARADTAKAELAAKTAKDVNDVRAQVDGKLKPLQSRLDQLHEKVKKVASKGAPK